MKRFLYLEIYQPDRRAEIACRVILALRVAGVCLRCVLAVALCVAAFVAFIPSALAFVLALILGLSAFVLWPRKSK